MSYALTQLLAARA